jgi:hypothetical protein
MSRISHLKVGFFLAVISGIPCAYSGGYNANWTGTVTGVSTYSYNDQIVFSLNSMPSQPPGTCITTFFAIDINSTDTESRNRMYATLLSAFLTGQTISIGYDSTGASCTGSFIQAFRVGF